MRRILGALLTLAALSALPAEAAVEWAVWGNPSGNAASGSFAGGQTVLLTANFAGGATPAGSSYTSNPSVPGRPDNTNPPFIVVITGTPNSTVDAGAPVAGFDLTGLPVGANVIFGLGDQKEGLTYRLEVRDGSGTVLSLAGIVVTPYNVTYLSDLLGEGRLTIADYNSIILQGNVLWTDSTHDAGGIYTHTGLTTFSSLPAGTRYLALYANSFQNTEGIQLYLGVDLGSTVEITDSAGAATDQTVPFGTSTLDVSQVHTVTVTNNTAAPVAVSVTGTPSAPFSVPDAADCSLTLSPAQACTVTVAFHPTILGQRTDSVTFDIGGTPATVGLSGTGALAPVSVSDSIAPRDDGSAIFGNTVAAGNSGQATVTVTNHDADATIPVLVTEGLAAPFRFLNRAACDGVSLSPGGSCTLTVVFSPTADDLMQDQFTLVAGGNTITVHVSGSPGLASADFQVSAAAAPAVVQPNGTDTTTISLTVKNNGPQGAAAVVTHSWPNGLEFVSATPPGDYDDAARSWDAGFVGAGQEITLQITARALLSSSGCLAVDTTVAVADAGAAVDLITTNDGASLYVGAPGCADLGFGLESRAEDLSSLDVIGVTHKIEVRNRGPSRATNVKVTVNSYELNGSTLVSVAGDVIDVGDLAVGEIHEATIATFAAVGNESVAYAVSVAANEPDPVPSDNTESGAYSIATGDGHGDSPTFAQLGCFVATAGDGQQREVAAVWLLVLILAIAPCGRRTPRAD